MVVVQRTGADRLSLPVADGHDAVRDRIQLSGDIGIGEHLADRLAGGFRIREHPVPGHGPDDLHSRGIGEPADYALLPVHPAAVEDQSYDTALAGVEVGDPLHDVVRGVERHELARCHQYYPVGVLRPQRDGEPPADHVSQDIVDADVGADAVHSQLLQGVEGCQYPAPSASYPGLRASGLHAQDPSAAFDDHIVQPPLGQGRGADVVQHGGLGPPAEEQPRRIVLRIAAHLHDLHPSGREREGDVRRHRGLADAAFPVDRDLIHSEHLGLNRGPGIYAWMYPPISDDEGSTASILLTLCIISNQKRCKHYPFVYILNNENTICLHYFL